ncbi:hypothetical protein Avbf_12841 [Armadillidium vulgare]|nr:hypothetical protein Avbf_12841 [Armadillidium vulgare]
MKQYVKLEADNDLSHISKNHSTHRTFLENKLPELSKFSKDLNDLFHCIDNLEDLVKKIEIDVNATETAVNKAELDLKININLPTTFKPLLIMKEAPYFPVRDGDTEFSAPDFKFESQKYFD